MATFRQMKSLVAPFLERHPEFIMRQRDIYRVPVQHCKIGMSFDRTGHADQMCLTWYVSFLFSPPPFFRGGFGSRMDRSWGYWANPGLQPKVLAQMEITVRDVIVDDMTLETAFEVNNHANPYFGAMEDNSKGLLFAALGDFKQARRELQTYVDRRRRNSENWREETHFSEGSKHWIAIRNLFLRGEEERTEIEKLIELLDRNDSHGVATLLHAWEASAVQEHKLERYWQPSPFPFELS